MVNKFKVGDKVVRTGPSFRDVIAGNVYTVSGFYGVTDIYLQDLPPRSYDMDYFELVEQKEKEMEFKNMKFDVAAIAKQLNVGHEEASRIIQEVLFEQGYVRFDVEDSPEELYLPFVFSYEDGDITCGNWLSGREDFIWHTVKPAYTIVEAEEQQEIVELNGKKYNKQELEKALSLLKPVE